MYIYKIIIIGIIILLVSVCCEAATIYSASNAQDDVQAAITAAGSTDTIIVPPGSGSVTWTATVTLDGSKTLMGPGPTNLTITDNTIAGYSGYNPLIRISGNGRVTGFRFYSTTAYADVYCGIVSPVSTSTPITAFEIDNCYFDPAGQAIITWGLAYGVIYNCTFSSSSENNYISVLADGLTSWSRNISLGTADAVYIEGCTFSKPDALLKSKAAVMGQRGGRFVFRYNTCSNCSIDVHGYCGNYSGFSYEVYENTFSFTRNYYVWMWIRGGTGVIYNNYATGTSYPIYMSEYRLHAINSCIGLGSTCCTEYPCTQQIGQSYSDGATTIPLYVWGNTLNSAASTPTTREPGTLCPTNELQQADVLQLNTDYVLSAKPGYTAYDYPHPLVGTDTTASPTKVQNLQQTTVQ